MHGSSYRLANVNGLICIVETTSDFNQPILHDHYWPTSRSTRDFLWFENDRTQFDAILAGATVRRLYGGMYQVDLDSKVLAPVNGSRQELCMQNGGQTQAVKVESRPYPKPRTNAACEYYDGYWRKNLKSGWVRC